MFGILQPVSRPVSRPPSRPVSAVSLPVRCAMVGRMQGTRELTDAQVEKEFVLVLIGDAIDAARADEETARLQLTLAQGRQRLLDAVRSAYLAGELSTAEAEHLRRGERLCRPRERP